MSQLDGADDVKAWHLGKLVVDQCHLQSEIA